MIRLVLAAVIVYLFFSGHPGDAFESLCIKGRLSSEQAQEVNALDWSRRPNYCSDEIGKDKNGKRYVGQSHCKAEKHDRILRASCSQFPRIFGRGD